MTPTTPNEKAFTFGDVVKSPAKSGDNSARMNERREIAARIIEGANAGIADVEDGHEVVVKVTAKGHTYAQVSRAINDTLGEAAYDGPFYARADKASGTLRIVKGKRPRRKSEAGKARKR